MRHPPEYMQGENESLLYMYKYCINQLGVANLQHIVLESIIRLIRPDQPPLPSSPPATKLSFDYPLPSLLAPEVDSK